LTPKNGQPECAAMKLQGSVRCSARFVETVEALAVVLSLILLLPAARAADFSVTAPGFFYSFSSNGVALPGQNPTLTLVRGKTYTFAVNTGSSHPLRIDGAPAGSVTNNNTFSGTLTFVVPTNAASYTYVCSIHFFGGVINTVAPPAPPPPTIRITSVAVGSNITLRSTGTNNWSVIPEYVTNLTSTNWTALTVQTNTFVNGTNETICGKPPENPVFIRIKSAAN
jgi:hypothetical protein